MSQWMVTATAPGKLILIGEHALLYTDRTKAPIPGIATAIGGGDLKTTVKIRNSPDHKTRIKSKYGNASYIEAQLTEGLKELDRHRNGNRLNEIRNMTAKDPLLPLRAVMNTFFMEQTGHKPLEIEIESNVPKNLGSSASVFAATVAAIGKQVGAELKKEEIARYANVGDMVAHGKASGIDATTVTHGGWLAYYMGRGRVEMEAKLPGRLVIVDSGQPVRTADMVARVADLDYRVRVPVMEAVADLVEEALAGLKIGDMEKIGNAMVGSYHQLRKLGISTQKLDQIVEMAEKVGAWAKPTGSWGGGSCVVLADEKTVPKLLDSYSRAGYKAFPVSPGAPGVKVI